MNNPLPLLFEVPSVTPPSGIVPSLRSLLRAPGVRSEALRKGQAKRGSVARRVWKALSHVDFSGFLS